MDTRFRSPGIPRKSGAIEDAAVKCAKNSKRSKSTENALEKESPFLRLSGKEEKEDPMLVLNKRWSVIAKNQETMTKQELLNSYRLLMNDHLRLERFLSIITKDSEMARNRLESDLLDAMMCIEDLKQALEVRMARRRKIDPREAEERRALIRQNKKLLNQLYESAKKIETLELTKLEMKEQLELLDFQMVELENQKTIVEDELRRQPVCQNGEAQTETERSSPGPLEDLDSGPTAVAAARAETAAALSELASQRAEGAALQAKHRHLENLLRELRRDNSEMREQIARHEEDSENSLAESDMHTQMQALQTELATMTEKCSNLQAVLAKSDTACENLREQLKSRQTSGEGKHDELLRLQASIRRARGLLADTADNFDNDDLIEEGSLILSTSMVQKLALELEISNPVMTEESLVSAVRNLKRLRNSLLSTDSSPRLKNDKTSPDFYSSQLTQLQGNTEVDSLQAQLSVVEKRRNDLESRLEEVLTELARAQAENRSNETALTASRRTEAALRRRLLASMDAGISSSQRGRPISSVDFTPSSGGSPQQAVEEFDAQAKIIKLEATNAALAEASHLDRARLQDQATRIAQLEAEHRTLHERMASLQASEACAQRASVRLQALYEDMLREFSEASSAHEASATSRRAQRRGVSDSRGYETDTAILTATSNKLAADDAKPCGLKACAEVRAVLGTLQERFIRTTEQLTEAETLLIELENNSSVACTTAEQRIDNNSRGRRTTTIADTTATGFVSFNITTALRSSICEYRNDETTSRLLNRLERWISAQSTRSGIIEADLRQQVTDLQMALADKISPKSGGTVLRATLETQKEELFDLKHQLEQARDELEITKGLCESQSVELAQFRAAALGH